MFSSFAAPQLRRGVLGPLVLALLEDQDRYGLELVRELSSRGFVASEGTVYPLLTRLQGADVVTSKWVLSDHDRPRRFYSITPAGRKELAGFRHEWVRFSTFVDAILTPGDPRVSSNE